MRSSRPILLGLAIAVTLSAGSVIAAPLPPNVGENKIGAGILFVDDKGLTLYTYERDKPGKSLCTAVCAKAWPPLAAAADAVPVGEWSPIARDDGAKQWALNGRPVYTYAKDAGPGTMFGDGAGNYVWRVAFVPIPTPAGLAVRTIALGRALADARGMTLYSRGDEKIDKLKCSGVCLDTWLPLPAPLMATGFGPWGIVIRPDGSHQWAYQGHPLYTFADEEKARESRGEGRDKIWHAVVLTLAAGRPAWVTVQSSDIGPVFADAAGHTLYTGPDDLQKVKKVTCDEACLAAAVRVVAADKDAKTVGDWSVVQSGDHGPVWAYRGSPVYTHTLDLAPGDIRGEKWASSVSAVTGWDPIVATLPTDEIP